MKYYDYMQVVRDSEKGSLSEYPKALHAIMGMNGEAGECVDILKKHIFQGHKFNSDHLLNELGDVCWYSMLLIIDLDIDPKFIFDYMYKMLHRGNVKEKPTYLGLKYLLNINRDCGLIIDIYYDNYADPGPSILELIRDVFYSASMIANIFDKTLEDIFDINYNKIVTRYPNGFSSYMSINRR